MNGTRNLLRRRLGSITQLAHPHGGCCLTRKILPLPLAVQAAAPAPLPVPPLILSDAGPAPAPPAAFSAPSLEGAAWERSEEEEPWRRGLVKRALLCLPCFMGNAGDDSGNGEALDDDGAAAAAAADAVACADDDADITGAAGVPLSCTKSHDTARSPGRPPREAMAA